MKKRVLFAIIIEGNNTSVALLKKFGFEQWGCLPQVIACYGEVRGYLYLGKILTRDQSFPVIIPPCVKASPT
jgi:L-amino acid N-acyltransferase YncA